MFKGCSLWMLRKKTHDEIGRYIRWEKSRMDQQSTLPIISEQAVLTKPRRLIPFCQTGRYVMFTLYPCFLAQKPGKQRNSVYNQEWRMFHRFLRPNPNKTKIPKAVAAPVWNSHKGLEPQVKMAGKKIFQEIWVWNLEYQGVVTHKIFLLFQVLY